MKTKCSILRYIIILLLVQAAFTDLRAQDIFRTETLHEIHLFVDEKNWFDSLQCFYDSSQAGHEHRFLPVTAVLDGDTLKNTGLRFKGQYSNTGFPGKKKPFRLDFNEYVSGQTFQSLKKLNLHNAAGDPSFLREYMASAIFRHLGIPASRVSFCRLYINAQYWGCYLIVEEPDKVFLQDRFGNKNGNLFECISNTNLEWEGNDPADYPELELKTGPQPGDWDHLLEWIRLVNTYEDFDFQQKLSAEFQTDIYLKILAVDVLINNWDSYYDNGRNFFLYDDPATGKLQWIPWDYNLSFWATDPYIIPSDGSDEQFKPLIMRIRNNPYLREKYLGGFCYLLDHELADFDFSAVAADAAGLIESAVEEDTLKFYTTADFYENREHHVTVTMIRNNVPTEVFLPGLTSLYRQRKNNIRNLLITEGFDCGDINNDQGALHAVIFPNPASDQLQVYVEEDLTACGDTLQLEIFDITGRKSLQTAGMISGGRMPVDVSVLSPGTYFIRMTAENKTITLKMQKI